MTGPVRIVGIGQRAAGDDGLGPEVIDHLRARGVPEGVELVTADDASVLVDLIDGAAAVVIVDAVVDDPPGRVRDLRPEDLVRSPRSAVSSHGLTVAEAIGLARQVAPAPEAVPVHVVAVTVARPARLGHGLSAAVAAAVPAAAARCLAVAREAMRIVER